MKVPLLILAVVSSAFLLAQCQKEDVSMLDRYRKSQEAVAELDKLWEDYVSTPLHDEEKRQKAANAFIKKHNETMSFEYEWLASVLIGDISNVHLSLFPTLLKAYRMNLRKTEAVFNSTIELYRKATRLEFNAMFILKIPEAAVTTFRKDFERNYKTAKSNAKLVLEHYQAKGWKEHLQNDVDKKVKTIASPFEAVPVVLNFLKTAYPFRAWFVLAYRFNRHLPYQWCADAKPYVHRFYKDANTELFVVHAPLPRPSDASIKAYTLLRRLTPSNWHWSGCDTKAKEIFREMAYKCGSGQHNLVMVLPLKPNQVTMATTDPKYVFQMDVRRHFPILCEQYYKALIFG